MRLPALLASAAVLAVLPGCRVGGAGAARGAFRGVDVGPEAGVTANVGSPSKTASPSSPAPAMSPTPAASGAPAATPAPAAPTSAPPDLAAAASVRPASAPDPVAPAPAAAPAPCAASDELTVPVAAKNGLRSGVVDVPPPAPPGLLAPMRSTGAKPVASPAAKPAAETATQPMGKPAAETAAKPAAAPAATPSTAPVAAPPAAPAPAPSVPTPVPATPPAVASSSPTPPAPPPASAIAGDPDGGSTDPVAASTSGAPSPGAPAAPPRKMRLVRDGLAADAVPASDTSDSLIRGGADERTASAAPPATPVPAAPVVASPPPARAPSPGPAPRVAAPASATTSAGPLPSSSPMPASAPAFSPPTPPRGFSFEVPRKKAVADHALALRAAPDDASRPCWPRDLVRTVPAATVLAAGDRPAIVVFYDDTARASRLAAADLLPVVVDLEEKVDLVLVDLSPGRDLPPDERKLVRRYYLGYVPTTVVLNAGKSAGDGGTAATGPQERRIRLLKSERVDPNLVRAAAEQP